MACGLQNMRHSLTNAALPRKKSLKSPKAKDISKKTRDISLKTRHISLKTRHISPKIRDILKPKAVMSVYAEDAAEIPLLKCNKINVFVKPNEQNRACSRYAMARKGRMKSKNQFLARAYARIYTRVLCFLLSHLSQYFASICKTMHYLVFEGF